MNMISGTCGLYCTLNIIVHMLRIEILEIFIKYYRLMFAFVIFSFEDWERGR